MLRTMTVTLALLAAGAVGCGSDDDDGGSGGSGGASGGSGGTSGGSGGTSGGSGGGSSVPRDKQLGDLTDSELTALCEAHKPALTALAESACTAAAALAEADEAACETARDECEASLADAGSVEIDCTDTSFVDYDGCEATVGELLDCSDELVPYAESLSCSDAGNLPDEPDCSTALQEQCPDVYQVQ